MQLKRVADLINVYFLCNLLKDSCIFLGIILNLSHVSSKDQSGHPAIWRDNVDAVKRAILVTDPTRAVISSGLLTEWHVYIYSKRMNQEVHLQVWRPLGKRLRSSDEYTAMVLIGFTKIVSIWPGYNRYFLYPEDRIRVEEGDLTALYFPGFNPIPWTEVECRPGRAHLFLYNPRDVYIGTELLFSTATLDWRPCRVYSYNCTVMSELGAARMDKRLKLSGQSPYGQRPYGKYIPERLPEISISSNVNYANHINVSLLILSFLLTMFIC